MVLIEIMKCYHELRHGHCPTSPMHNHSGSFRPLVNLTDDVSGNDAGQCEAQVSDVLAT